MTEIVRPQIGEVLTLSIDSVAFGGDGVSRHNNFVLFTPDVIAGEKVKVRVTEVKPSFGRALPLEILEPSPDRRAPLCPVFGVCGGCQYQHIQYPKQLALKTEQLKETLKRLGGLSVDDVTAPILASPKEYGYRNSVTVRVRKEAHAWEVGYTARDNRSFIKITDCPLASEDINHALKNMSTVMEDMESPKVITELTFKEGVDQVLLHPHYPAAYRYKTKERLFYEWKGLRIHYGLDSFFQVNPGLLAKMLELIEEALDPQGDEILFDLYAGSGLFSLVLAKKYKLVVGIEVNREAVNCFHENIKANSIPNIIIVGGEVEAKVQNVFDRFKGETNSILIDPPREGLGKGVAAWLAGTNFRKIVYVSCEISTLARDLKILTESYKIVKIEPLDMFPQTKHLETIVLLEKK